MLFDPLGEANRLRGEGRPFVLATVVRAERPTSAKPGAKAIVTEDGHLAGWVGGSCAEPTVVREALAALGDGRARLVRLSPPERLGVEKQEGVAEVPLTCVSGGTLEIFLEPYQPQPHLLAVGHLPVSEALVTLGKALGYRVSVIALEGPASRFSGADRVLDRLELAELGVGPQTAVVVASHGNYDEEALEAALGTEAFYVGLVASPKRAKSLLEHLRASHVPEERVARLKVPAGLDLGAVTPEEIALSIFAEILQRRRQQAAPSIPLSVVAEATARDPVCGMSVDISRARYRSEHAGRTYYFCASGCQRAFEKDPEAHLARK